MHHPDLFPETLLCEASARQVFATSLKVAEHFHKRHDNVIRDIQNRIAALPAGDVRLLNFEESTYRNTQGRNQPMYRLSRDGFVKLAMRFTGAEADEWQWRFLAAFNAMEAHLLTQTYRESNALYEIKPRWRHIAAHPEFDRTALIALTGHKSVNSITACRRRMRDVGLLVDRGQPS